MAEFTRYWEDFQVGETVTFAHKDVEKDEVIAFAREFDPQPFHMDESAAKASLLGGLAASGWHSCAMLMRMMCDGFLLETASMGSPGLEEVKWLKPVRPGDRLTARYTCTSSRASKSRPDLGICRMLYEVHNGGGDLVMTWDCTHLFGRRETGTETAS